ncbi:MAG: hypothetical protein GQ532_00465 [Methylomarinum sp.]|nr:hypothetical protein [Methylomarinum sp.]
MIFTEQELQNLSSEIDKQLRELESDSTSEGITKATKDGKKVIPSKQKQQLEQATGEEAETYLKKFACAAKKDLCIEGGLLHDQFEEMGNMSKKSMLLIFGSVLTGIGLPAAALQTTAVAVSVIVLYIGIKAFCEDCASS